MEAARTWDNILREQWVARTGIPERLLTALGAGRDEDGRPVQNTEPRAKLAAVRKGWRFVVVFGPPGTGKTFAAALWLLEQFDAQVERNAGWVSAVDVAAIAPWERRHDRLLWIPDLVIDDAGAEPERGRDRVAAVMWHRYEHSKRTLVTTNADGADFERLYSNRITSRIAEVGAWIRTSRVVRHVRDARR